MAITRVKSAQNSIPSGTAGTLTLSFTPAAVGNVLVAMLLSNQTGNNPSLTDSAGNTWTPLTTKVTFTGNCSIAYYTVCTNNSAMTITTSFSGGTAPSFRVIMVDEFDGVDQVNPINKTTQTSGSGNPTTTITPTTDATAIWAGSADSCTAVGSGYSKGADDTFGDWTEYRILTGNKNTSTTANFTGSGTWGLHVGALNPEYVLPNLADTGASNWADFLDYTLAGGGTVELDVTVSDQITTWLDAPGLGHGNIAGDSMSLADGLGAGYGSTTSDQMTLTDSVLSGYGMLYTDTATMSDALRLGYGAWLS